MKHYAENLILSTKNTLKKYKSIDICKTKKGSIPLSMILQTFLHDCGMRKHKKARMRVRREDGR